MATFTDDEIIGVPLATAARVAHVSEDRLRSWERLELVRPAYRHQVHARKVIRIYNLPDLTAMLLIRKLEERGFSLRKIAGFVKRLEQHYERPLAELTWATSGDELVITDDNDITFGDQLDDHTRIRETLPLAELRADVRRRLDMPRSEGEVGHIERRRGVQGNRPVFKGTRIPVATVRAYINDGATDREILEAFPTLAAGDIAAARAS